MCINTKERWLSTSAVANKLGVSPDTVRNLLDAGRFDKVRNISAGHLPRYQIAAESVRRFEEGIVIGP